MKFVLYKRIYFHKQFSAKPKLIKPKQYTLNYLTFLKIIEIIFSYVLVYKTISYLLLEF